ncbi:MAG: Hpt domain-containing protein [Marinifilaceae bacterium]
MKETTRYTDLTYLQEMAGNDKEIIKEMIDIFLEQIPEFTEGITVYFETRDWGALGALAHKAKSSIRTMGMEQLGDCLEKLEHLSKGNRKLELQLKQEKNQTLDEEEQRDWNNIKNEQENDIELKSIPDLIDCFLNQCPIAIKELEQSKTEL